MSSKRDFANLQRWVLARRRELDLNQDALPHGPTKTTLVPIEKGTAEAISPSTLRKLDKSLQWEAGSARRILEESGEPIPVVGATTQDAGQYVSAPGARVEGGASDDAVLRAIQQMQEDIRVMSERLAKLEEPDA